MCNSRIQVNFKKQDAYITQLHSLECLEFMFGFNTIIPSINKEISKREEIIQFANKLLLINPAINLNIFKEVIFKMIGIKKYKININESYLNHYFYNWKSKNRINTFYYAHDNPTTLNDNIFLQTLTKKIIFDSEKNKNIKLIYLVWASPFHITRMRFSPHFYIDFTFVKPIGMQQTLIILYIDLYTGLKIPGIFITLNSKTQISYEIIFSEVYRILTLNNTVPMVLQSYTIDYEKALENALKKIFPKAQHVGCFFHYIQSMIRWLKQNKYGSNIFKSQREEIIYLLTIILFKYKSDMNYIKDTIIY